MSDVREPSSGPTYHGLGNMDWDDYKPVSTVNVASVKNGSGGSSDAAIPLNHSTAGHVMGDRIESHSAVVDDKK